MRRCPTCPKKENDSYNKNKKKERKRLFQIFSLKKKPVGH
jgi:hypothetical protein